MTFRQYFTFVNKLVVHNTQINEIILSLRFETKTQDLLLFYLLLQLKQLVQ